MLRIQRLRRDIGNGGNGNCEINYMQGRKYPNASETVEPVQGVSNKNLLKNPYNTLNEPVPKAGDRPWMITTDTRGNVFAKSEVKIVKGVTNDTLLKNPYNILEMPMPTKRVLSMQNIKNINNKVLPNYVTENRGINEVMLQILTMIVDQPVKLITANLLKILITKNAKEYGYQTQDKVLNALNAFDQVMTYGRRIFRENTISPDKIPERLRQYVDDYEKRIREIYPNINGLFPNIASDLQTAMSELGLMSNGLTRIFEANNAVDPSNTLTQEQINAAALSGNVAAAAPPAGGPQQPSAADREQKVEEDEKQRVYAVIDALTDDSLTEKFKLTLKVVEDALKADAQLRTVNQFFIKLYSSNSVQDLITKIETIRKVGEEKEAEMIITDAIKTDLKSFCTDKNIVKNIDEQVRAFNNKQFSTDFSLYYGDFFFHPPPVGAVQVAAGRHRVSHNKYRKY